MPGTKDIPAQRQPVHADADFEHPSHPFALVVNVGLVDMIPENGSTEVWLGTHTYTGIADQEGAHGERASGRIKESLLEQRRALAPPVQPVIPKGSVVIRDLRLWHAGMPNKTNDVRVMLAMSEYTYLGSVAYLADYAFQFILRAGIEILWSWNLVRESDP